MSELPPDRDDDAGDVARPAPATDFVWTPELASGHVPGEPLAERRPNRVLRATVWTIAIFVVWTIAATGWPGRAPAGDDAAFDSGLAAGQLVGSILGAFLTAWLIWGVRFLWVRRRGGRADWTNPIVPVLAVFIAVVVLTGSPRPAGGTPATGGTTASAPAAAPTPTRSAASPAPSVFTLAEVLRIDPPYVLEVAPAAEAKQIADAFRGDDPNAVKAIEVRRLTTPTDGLLGFAVLVDADVQPGQEAVAMFLVERGMRGSNATRNHSTIGGRDVVTGLSDGAGYAAWVEPPYLKIVIVDDEATAKAVAAKFVRE
jgi:hypothetical protein